MEKMMNRQERRIEAKMNRRKDGKRFTPVSFGPANASKKTTAQTRKIK